MKPLATVIFLLFCLGLAGTDDFANEKLAEKELCKQQPKREWCRP